MEKYIDDAHIHEGHRERMRKKLLKHGQEIFDTYELLEMLLYHVIPYKDTNPISKRLLYAFGSLDGVLRADKQALMDVPGIGESAAEFLALVGRLDSIIGAEITPDCGEVYSSYESVGEFFVDFFADIEKSIVAAMFLDSSMRLISAKKLYTVDFESGGVRPKAFIDEALRCRASVIISAHNHPFGPFYPSPGDRATNNSVTDALNMAGLIHAEHYIVSGKKYAGIGSLKNFTTKLSQMPELSEFLNSKNSNAKSDIKVSSVDNDAASSGKMYRGRSYNTRDYGYFTDLLRYASGRNADDAAALLLPKYRIIEEVFNASCEGLISDTSEKCAFYLKLLAFITSRRNMEKLKFGQKYTKAEIADYLKALFLGQSVERTYLISFDDERGVLGCDLLGEGTVNSSEIMPRKAIEIAISRGASAVSIVHNHPGGVPHPSSDDINLTNILSTVFSTCDISLLSHYVIAGQLCEIINVSGE